MIKKYNQYIKEQLDHLELDPYGEEDWDDDNLSPILQISKQQNIPYDKITRLNCSNRHLDNLDGIENLINLQALYCFNNQLTNLNGIENLTNLKELHCYNNRLTNLNGLENLINLGRLYCSNNQLTNLNGIEKLNKLKILYCNNNNFSEDYKKYLKKHCKERNIIIMI